MALMRKRKGISAKVRWEIFKRDNFRCVYCGSQESLVIDHGDAFARGGEDAEDNYVTACRLCNAGKRDSVFLPTHPGEVTGVTQKGVTYGSTLLADWGCALGHLTVGVGPGVTRSVSEIGGGRAASICTDFVIEPIELNYEKVNVVVVPLRDSGTYPAEEQARIRNAAILGYSEATAILMGSPWHFYGVLIDERYKGNPQGYALDGNLGTCGQVWGDGWYPDECWDFRDPRAEFGLRPARVDRCGWHMTPAEGFEEVMNDGI
jgi:hypothetical protein